MDHPLPLLEVSPKPNIHCNLLRNLAPESSNRTIFAPLPTCVNNDPDQEYNSNSSLHASVEALLLLNNARVDSFEQSQSMGSGKENENERNFEIPITAPIPLSYSVRGVEALRSILSVGEDLDEITEPMDFDIDNGEQQPDPQAESMLTEIPSDLSGPPIYHTSNQSRLSGDERQAQAPIIIRSISPSTLMALTEPCLMAWCLDMDTGSESQPILPTTMPTSSQVEYGNPSFFIDGYIDTSYMDPTTRNLNPWGY